MKIIFILNFDNLIDKKKKQTMFWVVCLVLFASGGCSASNTTQPNVTQTNIPQSDRLYNDLMKDFNKYVRPTEVSPVTVNVTFFLVGIKEFDEVNGMFSVTGFFQVTWQDSRLRWNSSDYGDLQTLELPERKTWIPNISLLNPYVRVERIAKGVSPVRYSSSGIAVWLPGDVLSSRCEVDVTKYPFDTQTCRLLFGCWGYPSSSIVVQAPNPKVGTFYFIEHDTWEIVQQRVETVSDLFLTYVSVDITMKRHPGFAVINVVLPLIFFGLMNIFVFILPIESGERLSYCVTVLLAIAVFLTIVEQNLPQTSDPISILSYYVLANLGMSCFICFVVIIGLVCYNKDQNQMPVPKNFSHIARACCRRRKTKLEVEEENTEENEDFNITWRTIAGYLDTFMIYFCILFVVLSNVLLFAISMS